MEQDKKKSEFEQVMALEEERRLQSEKESEEEKGIEQEKEFESIEMEIESSEVLEKKKRREIIFEMALFLVLGILIGVTLKTEAVKKITIGFNDYQINKKVERYDVAALKKNIDDQIAEQQAAQKDAQQQAPAQQQGN